MARPLAVADLLPISYARHAGRSVEGVRRAAQERLIQGSVAGDVLVWMRRMVAQVAALYLQGQSQYAIAQQVGVTQQQVSLDLKIIQKAWLASTLRDFDAAKSEQLAKIDAVELAAWGAWERSQLSRQVTLTKRVMGDFPREEESLRAESSAGEAKFLDVVLKCIQQRCDLLGLGAQAEAAKAVSCGLASLLAQAKSPHPVSAPLAEA